MTQQVYYIISGDPNGYVEAQRPAMCYTLDGGLWVKINDSKNTQGWSCLITPETN